ncbi:MAG: ABC-F family ATP-binding cassette domain-containing protein [Dysgonamonadaceae bacterium]|jgi:ATP-binding cassette subfamily F protein uup|nr:ABC-F family ATP-binding cassette domain-containing protein [Dysgonamonadaceae bacterium]
MASYLQVDGLSKSFGDLVLFEDISFGIAEGQRIGLVAKNGAGKTTLLNILTGKEDYNSGSIVFRRDLRIAYLDQNPEFTSGITALQACSKEGYELQAKQMLSRFKINDYDQTVDELSGGQLKRVALASVLMTDPDLLILDEPTNHLDLEMIEWLEGYLNRNNRSLLMVTHDRYFLDRVCSEIIEIDNRQLYQYKGNYSYYLEKRQERLDTQNTELERANNLFRKELEWMRRQPQARATKAKARIDSFYDLENKVKQGAAQGNVTLDVKASYIGNKIFEAKSISKSYDDLLIVKDFDYVFARYEKMGIVGNNGTGKSTFIKMLMQEVEPDCGYFDIGETVNFGYYSQDGLQFDEQMKVLDVVRNIAEVIDLGNGKKLTASQFLQHFLFTSEKQYNFVHKLSGGEKRRLHLCTVLIRNPNFLVLDEPTNDLDIITLNILEEYLISFKGCVIVVSHDRYFIDKIVDHLLVFNGNGDIKDFPGNYTQYRDWKEVQDNLNAENDRPTATNKTGNEKQSNRNDKSPQQKKMSFGEKREFEQLDKEIPELEAAKTKLEEELSSGALSPDELLTKSNEIAKLIDKIDEKTMRWLELSEK